MTGDVLLFLSLNLFSWIYLESGNDRAFAWMCIVLLFFRIKSINATHAHCAYSLFQFHTQIRHNERNTIKIMNNTYTKCTCIYVYVPTTWILCDKRKPHGKIKNVKFCKGYNGTHFFFSSSVCSFLVNHPILLFFSRHYIYFSIWNFLRSLTTTVT